MRKPRKQPRSKLEAMNYVTVPQHRARLELVLDFNAPFSLLQANQLARNLMEAMQVTASGLETPKEFAGATLRSAEFKQAIRIKIEPAEGS